jgi:hypothetical protein
MGLLIRYFLRGFFSAVETYRFALFLACLSAISTAQSMQHTHKRQDVHVKRVHVLVAWLSNRHIKHTPWTEPHFRLRRPLTEHPSANPVVEPRVRGFLPLFDRYTVFEEPDHD